MSRIKEAGIKPISLTYWNGESSTEEMPTLVFETENCGTGNAEVTVAHDSSKGTGHTKAYIEIVDLPQTAIEVDYDIWNRERLSITTMCSAEIDTLIETLQTVLDALKALGA